MAKTVGFGKLRRKMLSNRRLPASVRVAVRDFKYQIKLANPLPRVFDNREGALPRTTAGQVYYEFQVGQATAPTEDDPNARGSHRLVALADAANNVLKMYYTRAHYDAGFWWQLQYP